MKINFTREQQTLLAHNPNVHSVSSKEIWYTNAFKMRFIEEYLSGKGPKQIFEEAGFSVKMLGYKRVERAAANWRQAYAEGRLGMQPEGKARQQDGQVSILCRLHDQNKEIVRLHTRIAQLEQLLNERRGAPLTEDADEAAIYHEEEGSVG